MTPKPTGIRYRGQFLGIEPSLRRARSLAQVKTYATNFCGRKTLREATREQVENFVTHLADWAEIDRNGLLCRLNSYLGATEGAA
jgi:hypothetical protein